MATLHITGLSAYLLALEGKRTPAQLLARIKSLAPDGILKGIPSGTRYDANLTCPSSSLIFTLLFLVQSLDDFFFICAVMSLSGTACNYLPALHDHHGYRCKVLRVAVSLVFSSQLVTTPRLSFIVFGFPNTEFCMRSGYFVWRLGKHRVNVVGFSPLIFSFW